MKPVRTWIVVADGARARILLNTGPGKGITPVAGASFETDLKSSGEIMSDRQGRVHDRQGQGRHAMENRSDAHRDAKRAFLSDLAQFLHAQAQKDAFDRLVLLAPPQALGDLRNELSGRVAELVVAEQAKDLTSVPDNELETHLGDLLAV